MKLIFLILLSLFIFSCVSDVEKYGTKQVSKYEDLPTICLKGVLYFDTNFGLTPVIDPKDRLPQTCK